MSPTYLRLEIVRVLRVPQLLIFTVVMPVMLFLVFANLFADNRLGRVSARAYTMQSMAAYGRSAPRCSPPPRSPSSGGSAGTGSCS